MRGPCVSSRESLMRGQSVIWAENRTDRRPDGPRGSSGPQGLEMPQGVVVCIAAAASPQYSTDNAGMPSYMVFSQCLANMPGCFVQPAKTGSASTPSHFCAYAHSLALHKSQSRCLVATCSCSTCYRFVMPAL